MNTTFNFIRPKLEALTELCEGSLAKEDQSDPDRVVCIMKTELNEILDKLETRQVSQDLKTHLWQDHLSNVGANDKFHYCNFCPSWAGKTFQDLQDHRQSEHGFSDVPILEMTPDQGDEEENLCCTMCSNKFKDEPELKSHLIKNHLRPFDQAWFAKIIKEENSEITKQDDDDDRLMMTVQEWMDFDFDPRFKVESELSSLDQTTLAEKSGSKDPSDFRSDTSEDESRVSKDPSDFRSDNSEDESRVSKDPNDKPESDQQNQSHSHLNSDNPESHPDNDDHADFRSEKSESDQQNKSDSDLNNADFGLDKSDQQNKADSDLNNADFGSDKSSQQNKPESDVNNDNGIMDDDKPESHPDYAKDHLEDSEADFSLHLSESEESDSENFNPSASIIGQKNSKFDFPIKSNKNLLLQRNEKD